MKRIRKMNLILGVVFAILSCTDEGACSDSKTAPKTPVSIPIVKITDVTLDGINSKTQNSATVGTLLTAKLIPADATNPTYQWMIAPQAAGGAAVQDGDYVVVPGATSAKYMPKYVENTKHIRVSVTAGGATVLSKVAPIFNSITSVFLSSGSPGKAGAKKITGLTKGQKYKITIVDGAEAGQANATGIVKYSAANGEYTSFVDANENAAVLTGTEITLLENDMTYKVEAIN